jgi:BirA family biotin operon repressor/biotin-[acetyl-CoA-carboxylase] ligase
MMSILFRPDIQPAEVNRLVMAVGLAAAEACEAVSDVRIDVKWPNDLQISGLKVAGILPESALVGDRLAWVVVGIGINVNQEFSPDDSLWGAATSLRMAAGRKFDRLAVLRDMLAGLAAWYEQIQADRLHLAWADRCVTLGQRVQVQIGKTTTQGLAEALDRAGALWVQDDEQRLQRVTAGEATVL